MLDRTTRPGRKPMGSELVEHLTGSELAKERLEMILETLSGQLLISDACEKLGIGESRFHQLRMDVLRAGLAKLEPGVPGRPSTTLSADAERAAQLERELEELREELRIYEVRQEVAEVLPHVIQTVAQKKTNRAQSRSQELQRRRARRRPPK